MIETVAHLAATGAIGHLRGVLNATTTYILSAMGEGRTYGDALREAQEARATRRRIPSFDVDGRDAAQKLAILASVAWGEFRGESTGGAARDPAAWRSPRGRRSGSWRRRARTGWSCRPRRSSPTALLARVSGIENLLEIEVRAAGTFRVAGPGAGGRVTAGAVYADLARLVAGERPVLFGGAS